MNLPAPIRALVSWIKGGNEAHEPEAGDRSMGAWFDTLNFDRVKQALGAWTLGNPREIAHTFEQFRRFPIVRAITRQALNAVKALDVDVVAASGEGIDPERAEKHAALFRAAWERIKYDFIEVIYRIRWEGGGFYEPEWREDEKGHYVPVCVEKIPLQRVRRDRGTGELLYALHAFDYAGVPLTNWADGVFMPVDIETDVQDFSCRGEHVAALTDLWRLRSTNGIWAENTERSESPTALLQYGSEPDRKVMKRAAETWGAGGRLVVSKLSDAKFVDKHRGSSFDPFDLFEQRAKARLSGLYLGEEQTTTVAPDQGSKSSATVHQDVADDEEGTACALIERAAAGLARIVALLNEGDERYAARVCFDREEESNTGQVLANWLLARQLIVTSEEQLREETGFRVPGPGETPIPMLGAAPAPGPTGPQRIQEAA